MSTRWDYSTAFSRNLGLISPQEQQVVRQSRIAIAGMGGVGGVHLISLVRQGFERFSIADFDTFSLANINRQYGAEVASVDQPKAQWMAEQARRINPEADIRIFNEPISQKNAKAFLQDASVLVDGIDAFYVQPRREVFGEALRTGRHVITAGPMGFTVSWLVFSPGGMGFDEYLGLRDGQSPEEMFVRFLVGLSPKSLHLGQMDLNYVDFANHIGPSSILACQMCAGVVVSEVIKLVTGRGTVRHVPHFQQFDPHGYRWAKGRVGLVQRRLMGLRVKWLLKYLRELSSKKVGAAAKA